MAKPGHMELNCNPLNPDYGIDESSPVKCEIHLTEALLKRITELRNALPNTAYDIRMFYSDVEWLNEAGDPVRIEYTMLEIRNRDCRFTCVPKHMDQSSEFESDCVYYTELGVIE